MFLECFMLLFSTHALLVFFVRFHFHFYPGHSKTILYTCLCLRRGLNDIEKNIMCRNAHQMYPALTTNNWLTEIMVSVSFSSLISDFSKKISSRFYMIWSCHLFGRFIMCATVSDLCGLSCCETFEL